MEPKIEICKFCGDCVVWVTVRIGHGPRFQYKDVPVSVDPDPTGTVAKYQEEYQVPGNTRIKKFPEDKRYRRHGYIPCVKLKERVS